MEKFSFEEENIKKMSKGKTNVLKWYGVSMQENAFNVGSLELNDPYSGEPIYVAPKEKENVDASLEYTESYGYVKDNNYVSNEENAASNASGDSVFDSGSMSEEDYNRANEIYERLMAEAAADEKARQDEIEAIKRAQEATAADYNAETGSYSGLYGKKPMSNHEAEALANIMNDNSAYSMSIEDIIRQNQG